MKQAPIAGPATRNGHPQAAAMKSLENRRLLLMSSIIMALRSRDQLVSVCLDSIPRDAQKRSSIDLDVTSHVFS